MRRYLLTAILLSSLCGVAWAGKPRLVRLHNSTYRVVNLPRGANGVKKLLELSRTNRGATLVAGGSYTLGPRLSCESNTTGCTLTENLRIGGAVGERVLRFDRLGRLTGAALYLDQSGYRRHEIDIVLSPTSGDDEIASYRRMAAGTRRAGGS